MESKTSSAWISEYLASQPNYVSAIPLEGGVTNYLYRLIRKDGSSVILKHAEPYASSDEEWTVDIDRLECEYMILTSISKALVSSSLARFGEVEVPQVISYDHENHNLIMKDCGTATKDLHTAFPSLAATQRVDYGRRLGLWLSALHHCPVIDKTAVASEVEPRDRKGIDQRIDLLSSGLPAASLGTSTPVEIVSEKQEFRELLEPFVATILKPDAGCLVHGDFWPGNILVSPTHDETEKDYIAVIDWESSTLGTGASDVGVFAAEAWLLCHFHSISAQASVVEPEDFGMLNMFLSSYLKASGSKTQAFVREALLQFAINLSVGRGGSVLMRPVKQFAIKIIKIVMRQNEGWEQELLKLSWGMAAWKTWLNDC